MQAVLLAAGESSRFFPYNLKHKCLIEIAGESIISHTIRAVKRSGITDVVIVVSENSGFEQVLGNGKKFGVKIRYVIQKKAEGMGNALLCAAKLTTSDFFLINSNHVEFEELKKAIDTKRKSNNEVVLVGKKEIGNHFGVLKVEGDKVISIIEKPKDRKGLSNIRVIGVYFLNQEFLNILKKERKDHYDFEGALDKFAKLGKVKVALTDVAIATLKYPWDLLNVKDIILSKLKRNISKSANVSKHSIIEDSVVICDGATVSENSTIKGPAYIGKNTFVGSNSLVRNGSSIEENSVVGGYMEVKNSLIMKNSKTHSGHFEDSILGENSRVGALFTSANVRLDRKNIVAAVKGEKVDTGVRSLGVAVGSNSHVGVRVTTMPGVIIGNNTVIGPATTVMKNVDSDVTYYTKVAETVERKKSAAKSS